MSTAPAPPELFVNLAVADLPRSMAFFSQLGFTFNPTFTNDEAACMVVGGNAYFMLLRHDRFADFALRPIADPTSATEALYALMVGSREEVDRIADTALASGGSPAKDAVDMGFMYMRTFCDPDGHHFEVGYMDISRFPGHDAAGDAERAARE